MNGQIFDLAVAMAKSVGLDPDLVCAMVMVESGGNAWSTKFEPGFKYLLKPNEWAVLVSVTPETEEVCQKISWGLLQIMGAVARQYDFNGPLSSLCDPATGLRYGLTHLKHKFDVYGGDEKCAVAAYNAGRAVRKPDGSFENQEYVDKVFQRVGDLRKIKP